MPSLKERAKTLVQLDQGAEFLYTDGPRELDAAAAKILTPEARALLARTLPVAGRDRLERRRRWKAPPGPLPRKMASSWARSPSRCAPP